MDPEQRGPEIIGQQPILIDNALPEDAKQIASVQHEGWVSTYPNEEYGVTREAIETRSAVTEAKIAGWAERLKQQGETAQTWVAREGQSILGFCSATKDGDTNHIRAIYILPDQQGKSIGTKLMTQALGWLGDQKDIVLEVVSYNQKAIRFYEKFGFVVDGSVTSDSSGSADWIEMPEIQMRRPAKPNANVK